MFYMTRAFLTHIFDVSDVLIYLKKKRTHTHNFRLIKMFTKHKILTYKISVERHDKYNRYQLTFIYSSN